VDENPRVRARVKRRPAKQIPLSPQRREGGVDENPRVRAGVKRRPAKQIPLSPQGSEGGVDENHRVSEREKEKIQNSIFSDKEIVLNLN
jgi:hypothetical protein